MKTFTEEEKHYLKRLRYRNYLESFKNQTNPLGNPMGAEEMRLRESIERKCDIYMAELALAQIAGVLPNKKMREARLNRAEEVLDKLSWFYTLESSKVGREESEGIEETSISKE
jgi:hypothetical protein